ncbi:hypothetical protein MSAN_01583200 [Mycena sanguinolenta]|uniref:Uncharacterized protein n=1 Tax=Mycena sanguinolenta TaxID=230812 RepID=A0A8H6Y330_9AGAR|nr:hypothetical protein MSAN_01583200 [Mycena sanguinolenta]
MLTAAPDRRSVTIPPTASTGVSNTEIITQSHSHRCVSSASFRVGFLFSCFGCLPSSFLRLPRLLLLRPLCLILKLTPHAHSPSPSHLLHSEKQAKAPVGLIVGVGLAVIAALFGLFFVRYMFVRRKRRREAFAGPGRTLGGGVVGVGGKAGGGVAGKEGMPMPMPMPMQPTDKDAVELASYPPPALPTSASSPPFPPSSSPPSSAPPPSLPPTHAQSGSWSTPFSASPASGAAAGEPGPQSTPAARQAYLAAELRAAQSLLERAAPGRNNLGDKSIDVKATKARIRELEERQGSAWALGLE